MKEKIVQRAGELMMQFGIRTVTMDDIAKDLGISKKTIYQYFKDKKELVMSTVKLHIQEDTERFTQSTAESKNSVEALFIISKCLRESMKDLKVNILHEMQRYYPDAWTLFEEFKNKVMKETIKKEIQKGQKEGYFRKEIDAELIATMRMNQVESFMLNDHLYSKEKYTILDVQVQLLDHFIHGLFTLKGHELFNHYNINQTKNEKLTQDN